MLVFDDDDDEDGLLIMSFWVVIRNKESRRIMRGREILSLCVLLGEILEGPRTLVVLRDVLQLLIEVL